MDIVAIATYFIAFLVATEVIGVVRNKRGAASRTRSLLQGLRPRHVGKGLLAIIATVLTYLLLSHWLPLLNVGWWTALGGEGSVILGDSEAAQSQNAPVALKVLPYVIPFGLLLILPGAARMEERMFRRGVQHQATATRCRRQLAFGLVHLLMGIPITAALALAVTGFAYQGVYLQRFRKTGLQGLATLEAARTHLAANLSLLSLVLLGLVVAR